MLVSVRILGVPGAWIAIAVLGEGHDWEHMAGILLGELLSFSRVLMIAQVAYRGYLRRTGRSRSALAEAEVHLSSPAKNAKPGTGWKT